MQLEIIHNPDELTYGEFYEIDQECFPEEPLSLPEFNEIAANQLWTAWADGILAGYAYALVNQEYAHLSRIAVRGSLRRRGIAAALINALTGYCTARSLPRITLYVQTDNRPAINLYWKNGFRWVESCCQFIVPIWTLIAQYRETVPHNLNAIPVSQDRDEPKRGAGNGPDGKDGPTNMPQRYLLQFRDRSGATLGSCHLDPDFPGCFPFEIQEPEKYLLDALMSLEPYLNPAKDILKLSFTSEQLEKTCRSLGFKLNYGLAKMERAEMERHSKGLLF